MNATDTISITIWMHMLHVVEVRKATGQTLRYIRNENEVNWHSDNPYLTLQYTPDGIRNWLNTCHRKGDTIKAYLDKETPLTSLEEAQKEHTPILFA